VAPRAVADTNVLVAAAITSRGRCGQTADPKDEFLVALSRVADVAALISGDPDLTELVDCTVRYSRPLPSSNDSKGDSDPEGCAPIDPGQVCRVGRRPRLHRLTWAD